MSYALPRRLKATATASIVASLSLAVVSFVFSTAVIGAIAFANRCLFIVASYIALWPLPKWGSFSAETRAKVRVWLLVFLVFTIASWMAFAQIR